MSSERATAENTQEGRQIIFRALVEAQDEGLSVTASRIAIAERYSVTEEEVKDIEREGLANQWPPL